MTMRIVGAGLGRTGTHSLKLALELLLGAPCYHMVEVVNDPERVPAWRAAAEGQLPDWGRVFAGYAATVDWPGAAFWREISAANPDALVLLSTRKDAASWWRSANDTIFVGIRSERAKHEPLLSTVAALLGARFAADLADPASAMAAYERHNAEVRAETPPHRLLEWTPGDGWEPLCTALRVPVPATPFPHVNTTAEFQARVQARMASRPPS